MGGVDASPSAPPSGPVHVIRTVLIVLAYLGLNSSLNLLNRYTLGHAGFRYPVSLTCAHLLFSLCTLAPLMLRAPYAGTHEEVVGRSWKGVAAIGTFMGVNIALNNASLLHLSLSLNQIMRASIPVICAICAVFVERQVPTPAEATGLLLVAAGVMGTVTGSNYGGDDAPRNETIGLVFCAVATVSNALMMTFSGRIMGGEKLDALRLTFYTSPVTLGLLAPVSLTMEWDRMLERLGLQAPPGQEGSFVTGSGLMLLVLLGCCNAVLYNWVHNKVILATSATTTTVLGNVKVAMLVLFSRVLFGETKVGP